MKVIAFTEHTHNGVKYWPGQEMDMTMDEKKLYESMAIGQRAEAAKAATLPDPGIVLPGTAAPADSRGPFEISGPVVTNAERADAKKKAE